jgi:hypothetical protein
MSSQVSPAYAKQYTDNVEFQFQQETALLRGTVRQRSVIGKVDFWERIAPVAAVQKTVRHGPTPELDTPHSRRTVTLDDWTWADLIDLMDKPKLLIDPQSSYTKNGASAMGRAFDSAIITAFDADALSGEEGETVVRFVSECAGDHNFAVAPLSLDKIIMLKEELDDHDVPEEGRHILLPPAGFRQLLAQSSAPNVSNEDFASVKALVKGKIDYFLGFTWHKSTLAPRPSAGVRYGFAWHEDAMGISIARDISTEVKERSDRSYSTQVHISGSFGAVRIQGEGVARFSIDESK